MGDFTTITHDDALALIERGEVTILDVRTPGEHEHLGHIPGSWLIPVDLVAAAPAILAGDDKPVLVYCEHGVRSVAASRLLAAAGVSQVLNLAGGMAHWTGPREFGAGVLRGPSTWLLENADLLPRGGTILDVACGRGRHALLLAAAGFNVTAIDRDADAIAFLSETASRLGLSLATQVIDLETDPPPSIGDARYDVVMAFNYLHRPLIPMMKAAAAIGGLVFYETFTTQQAERGHPKNPAYLLDEGELEDLMPPLSIVRSREGDIDGKWIASVVARRDR